LQVAIKELDERLQAVNQGVEMLTLLRTIPGIGPIWSVTIYAEVGDISRFPSRKAFASYTGLIPSIRASGEKVHSGGITHHGSRPLRHALVEAGIHAARKSASLRRLRNRVLYRGNLQKARVAVARKLSAIIYAMLKNGEPFRREAA
jgi:transposase